MILILILSVLSHSQMGFGTLKMACFVQNPLFVTDCASERPNLFQNALSRRYFLLPLCLSKTQHTMVALSRQKVWITLIKVMEKNSKTSALKPVSESFNSVFTLKATEILVIKSIKSSHYLEKAVKPAI